VKIVVSSADTNDPFSFVWCGVAPQPGAFQKQPEVILTGSQGVSGSTTTYTGTIYGGANNALAGQSFIVAGFSSSGNNGTFVCQSSTATTLVLNNTSGALEVNPATATGAETLSSASTATGGETVYTGAIVGGNNNGLAGRSFTVTGFANAANNGTFTAVASGSTSLLLNNPSGVAETRTAAASGPYLTVSLPAYEAGLPRVIVSGVAKQQPVSGNAPDATTAVFDNAIQAIATAFAQDGLQVGVAQVRTYVNIGNCPDGYCDYDWSDGKHPNQYGHLHVRDAVDAAITNLQYASRANAPVAVSCPQYITSSGASDVYSCPVLTAASKCSLTADNGLAASMISNVYISSKMAGSMVINHGTTANATFDVVCTQN
jgi:hypothetical protein